MFGAEGLLMMDASSVMPARTFLGALRLARGLTQPQLSKLAQVGERTIQRYESGSTGRVNLAILNRIAAVFGLPVQEVFPELFNKTRSRPGPVPPGLPEGRADA